MAVIDGALCLLYNFFVSLFAVVACLGIAQGSILSTMLCGYFYNDMEKTHFAELTRDPDSLLLRWVDDFLLITPRKRLAVEFLNTMHAGIPEYGCRINQNKTLINFDAVAPNGKQVKRIAQNERFPWCGFLFDTVTLEVRYDISRYHGMCNDIYS